MDGCGASGTSRRTPPRAAPPSSAGCCCSASTSLRRRTPRPRPWVRCVPTGVTSARRPTPTWCCGRRCSPSTHAVGVGAGSPRRPTASSPRRCAVRPASRSSRPARCWGCRSRGCGPCWRRVAPETDEVDGPSVLAVPYARVRAVSVQGRRRTWLLTAGVVAVTVLVVGLAYQVSRPEPVLRPGDDLPAVATARQDNPSEVVWWADGTLHLADAAVEVGDVQRLVAAGRGAAYVDGDGRLVAVTPDGHRTLLGRPTARSSLVSSPRLGLVAWTDDSVPDEPRIVVWDVDEGERVSGVVTSPRARTITFDGGWLTFGTGLTDWAWDPHGGTARETGNGYAEEPGGADSARRRRRRHPAGAARLLPPRGARREGAGRGGPRLRRDAVAGRPAGAGRRCERHRALLVRRPDRRRPRHSVPGRVARPRRDLRLRRPGRLVGRPGCRGPPDRHVQPRGVHRRGASPRDRAPR